MGVKIAVLAVASVLSFVQGRAQPDGGYAEPGGRSTVALTATAVLALRAARGSGDDKLGACGVGAGEVLVAQVAGVGHDGADRRRGARLVEALLGRRDHRMQLADVVLCLGELVAVNGTVLP